MAEFDRQQICLRSRLSGYLLIVILAAIRLVLLIKSDHLAVQGLPADATLETGMMKPDIPHHEGSMTIYKYRSISLSYDNIHISSSTSTLLGFISYRLGFPCRTLSKARWRPAPGNPSRTSPPPPPCTPGPGSGHRRHCTHGQHDESLSHRLAGLCR